jgi:hypothetical protein
VSCLLDPKPLLIGIASCPGLKRGKKTQRRTRNFDILMKSAFLLRFQYATLAFHSGPGNRHGRMPDLTWPVKFQICRLAVGSLSARRIILLALSLGGKKGFSQTSRNGCFRRRRLPFSVLRWCGIPATWPACGM